MTTKDYNFMFERQGGCCAICGKHQSKLSPKLSLGIDHDHKTNKVRELLCTKCNIEVGFVENGNLVAVIEYIKKHT